MTATSKCNAHFTKPVLDACKQLVWLQCAGNQRGVGHRPVPPLLDAQLVINEIPDSAAMSLQAVKLLAKYLSGKIASVSVQGLHRSRGVCIAPDLHFILLLARQGKKQAW